LRGDTLPLLLLFFFRLIITRFCFRITFDDDTPPADCRLSPPMIIATMPTISILIYATTLRRCRHGFAYAGYALFYALMLLLRLAAFSCLR